MDYRSLGFLRVAALHPVVRIGEPAANAAAHATAAHQAAVRGASIALFPELGLTGYTCEDLFHSTAVIDGARRAVAALARDTAGLPLTVVAGAPFQAPDGRVYNTAFVLQGGQVRGAIPKIHLPNYGEFYERRWFASGRGVETEVDDPLLGAFRLGARQLFETGGARFAVEICEDLWAPEPPSGAHALAGAAVILNLSASNELVAKADYRRELVRHQSARLNAAYVYVSCGPEESTKDLVYGGHALIAENGVVLAEGPRLVRGGGMLTADVDVEKLLHERSRNRTFAETPAPPGYAVVRLADGPPLTTLE
ncbi:MAG TPA: nitrilase-related carbon-nitrogen hydrolase, partial [Planctomycetota bacterium]|nr:nitrilase-related carbon-nitrogen hydrolase [Planctomycetota bacterium]